MFKKQRLHKFVSGLDQDWYDRYLSQVLVPAPPFFDSRQREVEGRRQTSCVQTGQLFIQQGFIKFHILVSLPLSSRHGLPKSYSYCFRKSGKKGDDNIYRIAHQPHLSLENIQYLVTFCITGKGIRTGKKEGERIRTRNINVHGYGMMGGEGGGNGLKCLEICIKEGQGRIEYSKTCPCGWTRTI